MFVTDLENIKMIHDEHYKNEFEFPDFSKFTGVFVAEDDDNRIVTAGGIKPIIESVIITDKSYNVNERVRALHKILDISEFMTRAQGFDQLHCFVQDELWCRQLENHKFQATKGRSLVLIL